MVITLFIGQHAFLSNFYRSSLTGPSGIVYPTAEHAFQASKTKDRELRLRVARAPTPGTAKRYGRQLDLPANWDTRRLKMMRLVLRAKFSDEHEGLQEQLMATGHAHLVEGNTWHDQFWGDCRCAEHAGEPGKNFLGLFLMELRRELA